MSYRFLGIGIVIAASSVFGSGVLAAQDIQTRFGGRIQNDWAWFIQNDASEAAIGDVLDGTEFRRARFYASGTVYNDVEFKVQYDFAGGDADFKDVWIGLKGIPGVASLRFGHQKEPFSLDELTSNMWATNYLGRALAYHGYPCTNP